LRASYPGRVRNGRATPRRAACPAPAGRASTHPRMASWKCLPRIVRSQAAALGCWWTAPGYGRTTDTGCWYCECGWALRQSRRTRAVPSACPGRRSWNAGNPFNRNLSAGPACPAISMARSRLGCVCRPVQYSSTRLRSLTAPLRRHDLDGLPPEPAASHAQPTACSSARGCTPHCRPA
jgi:hypothetical protein